MYLCTMYVHILVHNYIMSTQNATDKRWENYCTKCWKPFVPAFFVYAGLIYNILHMYAVHTCIMCVCGGATSVPTVFPASAVTWPIIPHTCCTYVDTRLSLPSLKYTVVARLLTCLHLSTSGDPAFDFTRGHASQHVISPTCSTFSNKT
jgi:hypothetical protein